MKVVKRFNLADFVIVIAIAAIICSLFFRNSIETLINKLFYSTEISYTVTVHHDKINMLHEGSLLFDEKETLIGEVKSLEKYGDDYYNIVIATQGTNDNLGTYIGDSEFIAPGKNLKIYTDSSEYFDCIVKKVEY